MQWQPHYAIGVETIDQQHFELFSVLDTLRRLQAEGDCTALVEDTFYYLSDYMAEHFANEERLMQECGFPGLHSHQETHALFKRQVANFFEEYRKNKDEPHTLFTLINTLTDWLTNHILTMDQQIGLHINKSS